MLYLLEYTQAHFMTSTGHISSCALQARLQTVLHRAMPMILKPKPRDGPSQVIAEELWMCQAETGTHIGSPAFLPRALSCCSSYGIRYLISFAQDLHPHPAHRMHTSNHTCGINMVLVKISCAIVQPCMVTLSHKRQVQKLIIHAWVMSTCTHGC